jgi:hypothetical protein
VELIKSVDMGDGQIFCKPIKNERGGGLIINCAENGNAHTVKAQYYKTSIANFTRTGSTFGATGIIQIVEKQNELLK